MDRMRSCRGAFFVLCLLALGGLYGPLSAFALSVSPPRLTLKIEPGKTLEGTILVGGQFERPTRVRISIGDWTMDSNGAVVFEPVGKETRSLAGWLSVSPAEFILKADKVQPVRYRLRAPAEITGGYWGIIFYQTMPQGAPGPGNQISLTAAGRIASTVYAEAERGAVRDGRVNLVTAKWSAEKGLSAAASFTNLGNTLVYLSGRFEIRDPKTDRILGRVPLSPDQRVLPGISRMVNEEWRGKLVPGSYLLLALVDFGGKNIVAGQCLFKVS